MGIGIGHSRLLLFQKEKYHLSPKLSIKEDKMSHHYPKGYRPQSVGEKELADRMSTKQIEKAIKGKEDLEKNDPEAYARKYHGS